MQETTRVYGLRGELREVRQPGGGVWAYGYDDLLRLTSITPPANSSRPVETFEWNDGLGRMTRHFAGQTWTYTYGSGETTETTPNGELRKTLVDGRGRAAAVQYTVTAANGPGITGKTLRWDGWDALVGIDETRSSVPVQTQTFTYDTSHRLTGVVRGLASVSYGYSNATRQPSSKNGLTYGYDALGRLSSVTAPWGVTSVTWEAGGQRLKTLGAETFEYYGQGWLKSVTTPQGVRTYAYDGRGNRLTETMTGSTVAVRRFSYDSADRLVATQEWDGHIEAWALHGDGAKQQELQWPAGTPFSRPFDFATANPAVTKNYTYRTDGTLQSVTDAISNFVEIGYTHDNNGQVTQRTVGGVSTTYGWDVDGRLVTANSSGPGLPTLAATYQYDGLGMRRRAQVAITPTNGPPVSTIRNWTWGGADGEDEVEEDGNVTTFVAGYRVGDGINVFSHDGIGSVVAQDDGANTNEARFSTWGTRTALGTNFGPLASSAGFTGHRLESALGLTYAEQRWLDSTTGSWLSRDPVGASSYLASPNELNPWLYAAASPTRFTDPSGRTVKANSPFARLAGQIFLQQLEELSDAQLRNSLLTQDDFWGESDQWGEPLKDKWGKPSLEQYLSSYSREKLAVIKNRAARYLGEVFRRNVGGVWDVCLHPRHLYYGLPIVTGYSSHRLEFCPTEAVISFLRTRELGFFARVLVSDMQYSDLGRVLPKAP